jgi:hypothetical protein
MELVDTLGVYLSFTFLNGLMIPITYEMTCIEVYVNLCFKILRFVALGSYLSFTFLNRVYTTYL